MEAGYATCLGAAILLVSVVVRAEPLVIEGHGEVVDNTTIEIWGQRIRLAGIVAPDPQTADGQSGKRYLEELLAGIRVRCEVTDPSFQFGMSGRCVAANLDIAEQLVHMGHARNVRTWR